MQHGCAINVFVINVESQFHHLEQYELEFYQIINHPISYHLSSWRKYRHLTLYPQIAYSVLTQQIDKLQVAWEECLS